MHLLHIDNSFYRKKSDYLECKMCLIIDANLAPLIFKENPDDNFVPIIEWLTSSKTTGVLVVGGLLLNELLQISSARRMIKELDRAGRLRRESTDEVNRETDAVIRRCVSDDPHIIALAKISGSRILCSHDRDLHCDFTNCKLLNNPRGRIYQNTSHKKMLYRYGHTISCGKT
jgi:hypothetical protein